MAEDLGEERFIDAAVKQVGPRHSAAAGARGTLDLGDEAGGGVCGPELLDELLGFVDGELTGKGTRASHHVIGSEENHLGRMKRLGDLKGNPVGIDPVGSSLAVEAKWRNDRDDPLLEEEFKGMVVDALNAAGEELVGSSKDARGMCDDRVGVCGAKVDGGEALHDAVGEPDGRVDGEFEGRLIGDPGAVGVGDGKLPLAGKFGDLMACAMHEHNAHAQRAQDGDV